MIEREKMLLLSIGSSLHVPLFVVLRYLSHLILVRQREKRDRERERDDRDHKDRDIEKRERERKARERETRY